MSYTHHEPYFMRAESKINEHTEDDNTEVFHLENQAVNLRQMTQVVFLNLAYTLLATYTIEEVRFLK